MTFETLRGKFILGVYNFWKLLWSLVCDILKINNSGWWTFELSKNLPSWDHCTLESSMEDNFCMFLYISWLSVCVLDIGSTHDQLEKNNCYFSYTHVGTCLFALMNVACFWSSPDCCCNLWNVPVDRSSFLSLILSFK